MLCFGNGDRENGRLLRKRRIGLGEVDCVISVKEMIKIVLYFVLIVI